jgi:small subunit ribosomal protein S15
MARMHSRKKGKAGSKRPAVRTKPSWVRYNAQEVELLITKLAKDGKQLSQIGMVLRDTYGVPDVKKVVGKSLSAVLKEKNLLSDIPEDLMALIKKNILIKKHIEANKKDMTARRGLELTDLKIRRLVKYYKRTKRLPADWSYDPEKIRLLIE